MSALKSYIFSITACSMICFIAVHLIGKDSPTGKIIQMICGLFMVIVLVSPFRCVQIRDFSGIFSDIFAQADAVAAQGENAAVQEMSGIIKKQVEAYVLEKASSLNITVEVVARMSDTQPMVPEYVTIKGAVSPLMKQRLEQYIAQELGVAKENQLWE